GFVRLTNGPPALAPPRHKRAQALRAHDKPATHRRREETSLQTNHSRRTPGNLVSIAVAEAASLCMPRKHARLKASATFLQQAVTSAAHANGVGWAAAY